MRLTLATLTGQTCSVDVLPEMSVRDVLALAKAEMSIADHSGLLSLVKDGLECINQSENLSHYGVKDGDALLVKVNPVGAGLSSRQAASTSSRTGHRNNLAQNNLRSTVPSSQQIRERFLHDPHSMAILKERNPEMAAAIESGDTAALEEILRKHSELQAKEHQERIRALSNPFDHSAQQYIEEEIKRQNIDTMYEHAMEHAPEVFGSVIMLYINCKINGHHVKAFVDSGAQSTILGSECAQRCNIMRVVDKRFTGIAKGVGTQKIVGRIHLAQLEIENHFFPTAFTVLEDTSMDMLLGLDMLKRHQCILDLQRNVLRIGTTGTETPFLSESELPPSARLEHEVPTSESSSSSASGWRSKEDGEEKVKKLVDMGFSSEAVVSALNHTEGNESDALAILLAGSQHSGQTL